MDKVTQPEGNLGDITRAVITSSLKLLEQEADLLESEITEKLSRSKTNLVVFAIIALSSIGAVVFLGLGIVSIGVTYTRLPLWSIQLLVAFGYAAAIPLIYQMFGKKNGFNLVPEETIRSIKENLKCLTTQTS